MSERTLRPHQIQALEMLRQSLAKGHRRPILQAATGFGKTVLAGEIINRAVSKGNRVAFVVPAISLIDQTVESLYRDGVTDVGVIQANHQMTDWSKPVQVCSIQTVARKGYPNSNLVLVDECHRLFDAQKKWMMHPDWQKVPFIGLSATPWTKGLGKYYDDLIISATTQELIDGGFLSPFRVFAPSHPDLTGVRTTAGDFNEADLSVAMDKTPLIANIVETWIRHGEGRQTLCFAVDCAHAKHLQAQFEAADIPCGYIDAHTEIFDRNIVRDKFKRGEYKVVCNVGTLTTGVDWDVRCIILARPTKSEMLFVQIIGRSLRTADGKLDALILDHSDTHSRLGFVTDIQHDHLNDGTEAGKAEPRKKPLPKECPNCAYLRPVKVSVCPNCGFKPEVVSSIDHVDGKLEEFTPGKKKKANYVNGNQVSIGGAVFHAGHFYGQLKSYARERGYSDGWVSHQFREFVGVWPNAWKNEPEVPLSFEVSSWIKSRMIRFAKARDKRAANG